MKNALIILILLFSTYNAKAQPVPAGDENIPFLMTFGANSETSWGDDDFSQTFFFSIPKEFNEPIFIRIFDPDIGGKYDEINFTYRKL
jgi:hypothetical protein